MKKKIALIYGVTGQDGAYLAKFLLKNGADPNVCNSIKQTPLIKASLNKNIEMVKLLLKYGAKPILKNILIENKNILNIINSYKILYKTKSNI